MGRKCEVKGCEKVTRSGKSPHCEMHYYRLRRNGTLDTVKKRVPDAPCKVDDCEARAYRTDGFCRNCGLRFDKNGTTAHHAKGELHYMWLTDEAMTYNAIHSRLRKHRGSARNYQCSECGKPAKHWSYNHDSRFEKVEMVSGYEVSFGTRIEDYSPRCVPCHKRFDLEVTRG